MSLPQHVWTNPPKPFHGEVIAEFNTEEFEMENEDGEKINPFGPAKQRITRVCTTLSSNVH